MPQLDVDDVECTRPVLESRGVESINSRGEILAKPDGGDRRTRERGSTADQPASHTMRPS